MKKSAVWMSVVVFVLAVGLALGAETQKAGAGKGKRVKKEGAAQTKGKVTAPKPPQDPTVPVAKETAPESGFMKLHASFVKRTQEGPVGLLFLGDSITRGWDKAPEIYKKNYEKYQPANFGIGGDQTQHVLWQITNGELEGINPKVVVLMIGTNNTGGNTAEDITKGVVKIVQTIREKLPKSKVLLLAVFPRTEEGRMDGPRMGKIAKINAELAKQDDGKMIRYLDINKKFLGPDGVIPTDIMKDGLHPNEKGYEIWAEAMQPLLEEMLK